MICKSPGGRVVRGRCHACQQDSHQRVTLAAVIAAVAAGLPAIPHAAPEEWVRLPWLPSGSPVVASSWAAFARFENFAQRNTEGPRCCKNLDFKQKPQH